MKKAKSILLKLFFPPKWVIFLVSLIGFGGLIWVFASKNQHGIAVYTIYGIYFILKRNAHFLRNFWR